MFAGGGVDGDVGHGGCECWLEMIDLWSRCIVLCEGKDDGTVSDMLLVICLSEDAVAAQ